MFYTRETLIPGAQVVRLMLRFIQGTGCVVTPSHSGIIKGEIFRECDIGEQVIVTNKSGYDVPHFVNDLLGTYSRSVICVDPETAQKYQSGELKFDPDAYAEAQESYYETVRFCDVDGYPHD